MSKFKSFIGDAILEAKKALKLGQIPIGAVVVKDGIVIGRGFNKTKIDGFNVTDHAEILAINDACKNLNSKRLDGCDIYITLKPCAMCFGAIKLAKIRRIYYACDNDKYNLSKDFSEIANHDVEIYGDIDDAQCSLLLKEFFEKKRLK